MDSLIFDIDSIARHFQGLSFFWEALRMSTYVRWPVTVHFSSLFLSHMLQPKCTLITLYVYVKETQGSNRSDKWLTLETSAFKLFTFANLRFQLS